MRVRQLRQVRGLTAKQLCGELAKFGIQMGETTLTRLETGHRAIVIDEVVALAAALGVRPQALYATERMTVTL